MDNSKNEKPVKVIAVDLDGTLAYYDGWKGVYHIGAPIRSVVNRVIKEHEAGNVLYIHTARISDQEDRDVALTCIETWLTCHGLIKYFAGITCIKQKNFAEFWDDRAIQVVKNEGLFIESQSDFEKYAGHDEAEDECATASNGCMQATPVGAIEGIMNMNVFKAQEGGSHYSSMAIQPGIYSSLNNLTHYEASIVKYISRHKNKNGLQDIKKVIECAKQLAAIEYGVDL